MARCLTRHLAFAVPIKTHALIIIAAWLVGVLVSFNYGNRRLPGTIFVLGLIDAALIFTHHGGWLHLAALAIMTLIIWLSNKFEMV